MQHGSAESCSCTGKRTSMPTLLCLGTWSSPLQHAKACTILCYAAGCSMQRVGTIPLLSYRSKAEVTLTGATAQVTAHARQDKQAYSCLAIASSWVYSTHLLLRLAAPPQREPGPPLKGTTKGSSLWAGSSWAPSRTPTGADPRLAGADAGASGADPRPSALSPSGFLGLSGAKWRCSLASDTG